MRCGITACRLLYFSVLKITIFSTSGWKAPSSESVRIAAKEIVVDRKAIAVDSIKTVGEYTATVKLHREVKATVSLSVVAE